jgi:hypothetical protein
MTVTPPSFTKARDTSVIKNRTPQFVAFLDLENSTMMEEPSDERQLPHSRRVNPRGD